MRTPLLDGAQGLVAIARQAGRMAFVLENSGDQFADVVLVVDDKDVSSHLLLPQCLVFQFRLHAAGMAGRRGGAALGPAACNADGQADANLGAARGVFARLERRVFEEERAAVLFDDLLHDRKPETCALVSLGRDIGLKQPRAILLGKAGAVVAHAISMCSRLHLERQPDAALEAARLRVSA